MIVLFLLLFLLLAARSRFVVFQVVTRLSVRNIRSILRRLLLGRAEGEHKLTQLELGQAFASTTVHQSCQVTDPNTEALVIIT